MKRGNLFLIIIVLFIILPGGAFAEPAIDLEVKEMLNLQEEVFVSITLNDQGSLELNKQLQSDILSNSIITPSNRFKPYFVRDYYKNFGGYITSGVLGILENEEGIHQISLSMEGTFSRGFDGSKSPSIDSSVESLLEGHENLLVSVVLVDQDSDELNKKLQEETISDFEKKEFELFSTSSIYRGFEGFITLEGLERLRSNNGILRVHIPSYGSGSSEKEVEEIPEESANGEEEEVDSNILEKKVVENTEGSNYTKRNILMVLGIIILFILFWRLSLKSN